MGLLCQVHVIPVGVGEKDGVTATGLSQPGGLGRDGNISPSRLSPASSRIFVPPQVTWIRFPPIWFLPRKT